MINNILYNRSIVSKWKPDIDTYCQQCHTVEDNKHLILNCENVKNIWTIVSAVLNIDIKWKHIVLGFYSEQNIKICLLNNIISFISYRIYKYKMYCRLEDLSESSFAIQKHIKHECYKTYLTYKVCYKNVNFLLLEKLFLVF